MHLQEQHLESRRLLGERKALACVVCLLLLGWGWLIYTQPEFIGFDTIKEALTSRASLQVNFGLAWWRAAGFFTLQRVLQSFLRLVTEGLVTLQKSLEKSSCESFSGLLGYLLFM